MHLLYYDEVKYDPPVQKSFWLGGICVAHTEVPSIEARMNALSADIFGSSRLEKATEFHGIEICRGKGNFKGQSFDERIAVLRSLLDIIADGTIYRITVEIIPRNITHSSQAVDEIAFMYFIEQADALFQELNTLGMIFGDYDEPVIGKSVASLSHYRRGGTHWARGREIQNIVDTVHFAQSHHSRLIQLADVFLYCTQFHWQDNSTHWRAAIDKEIVQSGVLKCHKSRTWPTYGQWFR